MRSLPHGRPFRHRAAWAAAMAAAAGFVASTQWLATGKLFAIGASQRCVATPSMARRAVADAVSAGEFDSEVLEGWEDDEDEEGPDEGQEDKGEDGPEDRRSHDDEDFLFAKTTSRVGSLAGGLAKMTQATGQGRVGGFGAESVNAALKAVAIANDMLHDMGVAKEDQALAALPYIRKVTSYGEGSNMLMIDCFLVNKPVETEAVQADGVIIATGDPKKLPKMSAAIKKRVKENGVAVVIGAGPERLYRAVKAMMRASSYLLEDRLGRIPWKEERKHNRLVAALPSFHDFTSRADMVRIGLRLDCVQVDEPKPMPGREIKMKKRAPKPRPEAKQQNTDSLKQALQAMKEGR